jgi:ribosomal protein S12 methylthiotransferase accessory factor
VPANVAALTEADRSDGELTASGVRQLPAAAVRSLLEDSLDHFGVTRVASLTGFDHVGIPVHMAVRPQGRTLSSGSGKGLTTDASWVSAVMEAAEQTVWESVPPSTLVTSEDELSRAGEEFVSVSELPMRRGAIWNTSLPIRWRLGRDLVTDREILAPDTIVSLAADPLCPTFGGSNGLAAGTTFAEASLSALLEIVERDALTIDRVTQSGRPIDARSAISDASPELWKAVERARLPIWLSDVTTEIDVPVMVCRIGNAPGESVGAFLGAGASLSGRAAIVRAVTEALQSRVLVIAGARDDIFGLQRRAMLRQRPVEPTECEPPTQREHSTRTVNGDLADVASRLADAGFERVVRFDIANGSWPVAVARVVVPGLEGYPFDVSQPGLRARTAQGRRRDGG